MEFTTLTDDQLLQQFEQEITQAERWLAMYKRKPCTRIYHWFTVHREIVHLIASEFEQREVNTISISTILSSAGISFKVLKNQVLITP